MSVPRNHHFVSQIHIKNFFNSEKKKIFLFDKTLNNHYSKKTTKSIFSEKDLNSIFDNGNVDHFSLENDLNKHFEKDFPHYLKTVKEFIKNSNFTTSVEQSLFYFAGYGVVGEIRNPNHKQNLEYTLRNALSEIFGKYTDNVKNTLDQIFEHKKEVKYINSIQYSKFAKEMLDKMGEIIFIIETPKNKDDYFLLTDTCSINQRDKINKYPNPDIKEIAYIGLPLSSKIYIHFYSSKIKNLKHKSGIFELETNEVNQLNKMNFDYCSSKVACENEEYLKYFIKNVVQHRL